MGEFDWGIGKRINDIGIEGGDIAGEVGRRLELAIKRLATKT